MNGKSNKISKFTITRQTRYIAKALDSPFKMWIAGGELGM
jgi:hypothetical protein